MQQTRKAGMRVAGLAATLLVAMAAPALAISLVQCNKQIDGSFVPVLMVEQGGQSTTYRIGDKGLTNSIIFSERKAKAWARSALGISASDYHACGYPSANDRRGR